MVPTLASAKQADGLVRLLSHPEGSSSWAAGLRDEIQACLTTSDWEAEYVSHCLSLLRRSGGWRLLCNSSGRAFRTFSHFCQVSRPHGLGLTDAEFRLLLSD